MSNKIGYCLTLLIGGLCGIVGFILSAILIPNLYFLSFTQGILIGCGSGIIMTPSVCAIELCFQKYYLMAHSLSISGIASGYIIFPLIFRFLIDTYNIKDSLFISGAIFANIFVAAFLLVNINNPDGNSISSGLVNMPSQNIIIKRFTNITDISYKQDKYTIQEVDDPQTSIKKSRLWHKFISFLLYASFEQAGAMIITIMISNYSESLGLSQLQGSSMISFIGFGDLSGSMLVLIIVLITARIESRNKFKLINRVRTLGRLNSLDASIGTSNISVIFKELHFDNKVAKIKNIESKYHLNQSNSAVLSTQINYKKKIIFFHLTVILHCITCLAYLVVDKYKFFIYETLCFLNYIFGILYGCRLAILTTFIIDVFGKENFTKTYSLYVMFAGLGALISIPVTSWIIKIIGTQKSLFYLTSLIFTFCEIFLIITTF
ncbi:uncharacterized protein LOC135923162 isoform X2 [Gordionus sp. m RMFG-2023]